jgi:hypothetical protein
MFRRLAPVYSIFIILAGLTLIREASVGPFSRWERMWQEWLQQKVTPAATPGPVTLVEINNDTIEKHPWPWGPDDFSLFFHTAMPFEPQVLAVEAPLDFERGVFSGRERQPMFEKMLLDHIHRAPKLVLGGRLGWSQDSQSMQEVQATPVVRRVRGDIAGIPEFTTVEAWAREDYRLSSAPGWVNLPESDPPAARCPLLLRYRGQVVPGIVLQTLMLWEKITPDEVEVVLGSHIALGESVRIPIDSGGRLIVNLRAAFNRAAFDDFVLTRQQLDSGAEPQLSPGLFKNKALFLARTDAGTAHIALQGGQKIPSGEVFAAALATVHSKAWIGRVGEWFDWALIGALAIAAMWFQKGKWWAVLLFSVGFLGAYYGLALWCVNAKSTWLPGILPLGLIDLALLLRFALPKKLRVILF